MMSRPNPDNSDNGYAMPQQPQQFSRRDDYRFFSSQGMQAAPQNMGHSPHAQQQQQQQQRGMPHHSLQQHYQFMEAQQPPPPPPHPQQAPPMMQQQPGSTQFYRTGSPSQLMPHQYATTDASPSVARMHVGGGMGGAGGGMGGYPMSATATPTTPAVAGYEGGGGVTPHHHHSHHHPGSASAMAQAEREEELLLNLLIARRQRGRVADANGSSSSTASGSGARTNPSLSEELMRLRQQQSRQQQQRNIPPMPGMPPLLEGMGGGGMHSHPGMPQQQQHQQNMNIELHERIDRSPTRALPLDARMSHQEMLDYSARGIKRGFPFAMPPYAHNLAEMGDIPKKKRKHKKKPADMPRRPLSAYNLFFSEERERILKEIDGDVGKEGEELDKEGEEEVVEPPPTSKEQQDQLEEGGDGASSSPKPKALTRPLIPSEKKRRPHRKTHGKISFQELARMVGERWKNLPEERREYYQDLAKEDMTRQKAAMEEYYAKQNTPTSTTSIKKEDASEDARTEEAAEGEAGAEGEADEETEAETASPAKEETAATKQAIEADA